MKKAILISRDGGETRACLLQSGKLVNVDAEGPSGASIIGNIYKGRISDIHRGLNAAFVDVGEGKEGFLSIQDIHPAILEQYDRRPHMNDIFKRGQEILVQVLRDPVGDKGAMLTTCISLPGRYVVLMPASENSGISKKLPEEERTRLREIVDKVEVPDGFGIIVRTAGSGHTKQEINRDLNQLIKLWNQIEKVYGDSKAPSLVVQEQSVAIRFLRDYLTTDMAEIVVDNEEAHKEVSRFLNLVMPRVKKQLSLYTDQLPLFIRYGVEAQLEKMFLRDVPLPSGGRIVIDTTEALIAVDVNSGRHKEKNVEETALRANLEAAEEIASQIMLRDLGGLLVIDFIDMYQAKNRTAVQKMMRDCLKDDKAKVSIGRISQFGLLEMTRQRLRSGIVSRATEQCSQCKGVGYRRTTSSSGLHILRRIRELAAGGTADIIKVVCPVEVANFVQNSLRDLINTVEQERNIKVLIEGNPDVFAETLEQVRLTSEEKKGPDPVSAPVYGNHDVAEPKRETGVAKQEEAKQEETQLEEAKTEEPKKPRRSRRPRKKADADKPATETAESESAAKETKSAKDGEETPKKPRRSRRPRKKAEGDKPATEAAKSKTAASKKKSEGDDSEAKPLSEAAKRRRRRGGRGRGGKPAANAPEDKATAAPEKEVAKPAAAASAAPPPLPARDPYVYSPPPQAPAWDGDNRYQPGQDSLLDKVLKKLLKLER
jgi:ribonuclease E